MSTPSFSNIDLWLFELAEGNLSSQQVEQLKLFLLQYPELEVDKDMWELASVRKTPVVFPKAETLERRGKPVAAYFSLTFIVLTFTGTAGYVFWSIQGELSGSKVAEASDHDSGSVENSFTPSTDETNYTNYTYSAFSAKQSEGILSRNHLLHNHAALSSPRVISQATSGEARDLSKQSEPLVTAMLQRRLSSEYQNSPEQSASPDHPLISEVEQVSVVDQYGREFAVRETHTIHISTGHETSYWNKKEELPYNYRSYKKNKYSFKMKLRRLKYALQNMMDNPTALNNLRDPHYLIPGMLPNDVNFGSNGTLVSNRIQVMSRAQWPDKNNQQLMSQLSVDGYSHRICGGWGVQLSHSIYGRSSIHVSQAAISYSPKFSMNNNRVSIEPSVRFKMGNKILNPPMEGDVDTLFELERGNVHYFDIDGNLAGKNSWYNDLGAGLLVNTRWFYAGVQLDNLLRNYTHTSSEKSKGIAGKHFITTLGTDWVSRKKTTSLSTYVVYQHKESLSEGWLGVNVRWKWLTCSLAGSTTKDHAASVGMKLEHVSLNYQIDRTVSQMKGERALSHQLTFRIVPKTSRHGRRQLNF